MITIDKVIVSAKATAAVRSWLHDEIEITDAAPFPPNRYDGPASNITPSTSNPIL